MLNELCVSFSHSLRLRSLLTTSGVRIGFNWHFAFMPYGQSWKAHRKIFHQELNPGGCACLETTITTQVSTSRRCRTGGEFQCSSINPRVRGQFISSGRALDDIGQLWADSRSSVTCYVFIYLIPQHVQRVHPARAAFNKMRQSASPTFSAIS